MLGNLSKVLFKATGSFNTNEENNNLEYSNKLNEYKTLNSYNSGKDIINYNCYYFRERDFWKKNFEPEINFNHNKRLSFYLNSSPQRKKTFIIDKNIINLNKKFRFNTISKNEKYSNLLIDSPANLRKDLTNNFSSYKQNILASNSRLNTDSNKIIKNKFKIKNNNIYNYIRINTEPNENKKYLKFPSINNIFKSQEALFQDTVDSKLKSLISVKPEIKEQLKTKYRSMVGKRDFLTYLNYRKKYCQNPFYESMKLKEEINNF